MKRIVISTIVALFALSSVMAQEGRRFTINDLLKVRRVGDPQLSPDGRMVAFTINDIDKAANRGRTQIYLVPIMGGEPRQLTNDEHSSSSPRWSPVGDKLAFISARDGAPQIWMMDVSSGEIKKVTNISTGAGDPVWSPDGKMLAFSSDVYPECTTDACNKEREEAAENSKVKAHMVDRLLFRHWTAWKEGKRTHVFIVSSAGGEARDVTPGDFDAPPFSLGGPPEYAFSPDSKELAFSRNTDKVEATSTNSDLFIVPTSGGTPRRITVTKGADQSPQYSPDGRFIAYRSQLRPGYESDRWRLMLYDRRTKQSRSISEQLDSSVDSIAFTSDGQTIYFTAEEKGQHPFYSMQTNGGAIQKIMGDGFYDDLQVTRDGKNFVFSYNTADHPNEIYAFNEGSMTQLSHANDAFISQFKLQRAEEVMWTGGAGTKVSGLVVKPSNFSTKKRWPLLVLIHGGPQGAWSNNWGYRWNPQVFANAGYVVFMPNPRGSTGYGQRFVEEISGDWGGKAYTDIMNGVAYVISKGYVDRNNIGAAGGSFGGYMVDWIEGHNNDPRFRFKALVSHAGVYNLTSMFGVTEELWFPEWEFKGTPWTNPVMYERFSPHMYVRNFKTPLLVTHGEQDFRVPYGEGLQLFTALQLQGVESKLLFFPDEGHWILKPQNSELWYNTVLGWFDKHLK